MDLRTNGHNFLDVPASNLSSNATYIVTFNSPATEIIPSWTAQTPEDAQIEIYIKPAGSTGEPFCLGKWSKESRTSINNQKDDRGRVATDTLILNNPTTQVEVQIKSTGLAKLESFRLIATNPTVAPDSTPIAPRSALSVPQRAQMNYPGGNVLCSPTSVSMVTAYWSSALDRPDLNHDVPEVQKGVFDPAWPGTGNWPFNTAYAGSLPGMTGFVTRMRNLTDAASWLDKKVPVICSVSYAMLKGAEQPSENDGHIVVLVGFDTNGDPIFNDPGRNAVRMTYKAADFDRAWSKSGRTVYLIYPKFWRTPHDGPWPSRTQQEISQ